MTENVLTFLFKNNNSSDCGLERDETITFQGTFWRRIGLGVSDI